MDKFESGPESFVFGEEANEVDQDLMQIMEDFGDEDDFEEDDEDFPDDDDSTDDFEEVEEEV